ncbi:MAG: ribosome rescue protein RqcH [Sulfolobales archaeon]
MTTQIKLKSAMTSVDIAVTIKELKSLENCVVRSVLMPTRDVIVLELGCGNDVKHLVAESGRRIHLVKTIFTSESVRTVKPFRRVLEGSKVIEISQLDFERVVLIRFRKGQRLYSMYVELLPRGVIALVDEDKKIVAINRKLSARDRVVSIGRDYVPPPRLYSIIELNPQELSKLTEGFDGTVAQLLVRTLGLPPEIINEVLSEEERSLRLHQVDISKLSAAVDKVRIFVEGVLENPRPCAILVSDAFVGFYPFIPSRLPDNAKVIEFASMNELLEEYFKRLDEAALREAELVRVRSFEASVERTLKEAEENLTRMLEQLSKIEKAVELLERNYYEVETTWSCCRRVVKEKGWTSVSECGSVSGDPERGVVRLQLPGGVLEVLLYKDLSQQYAELKREYEHLKEKVVKARETIGELRKKLEEVVDRRRRLESLKVRPRRTAWFSRFLWIETSGGFLAVGGKDASQNELLVRKYLGPKDVFMHADIHGASVFVILTKGREVPEEDLKQVACLAASYSKAWKAGLSSVDVFWVWGEQVGLAAPSGEYLPRGSFMVYGQKNYIRSVKLMLSIGIVYLDDSYDLIVGPPELVESRSVVSVTVVPGETGVDKAAKEIRDYFVQKCPDVKGLTARDIVKLLPGKIRIVSRK